MIRNILTALSVTILLSACAAIPKSSPTCVIFHEGQSAHKITVHSVKIEGQAQAGYPSDLSLDANGQAEFRAAVGSTVVISVDYGGWSQTWVIRVPNRERLSLQSLKNIDGQMAGAKAL